MQGIWLAVKFKAYDKQLIKYDSNENFIKLNWIQYLFNTNWQKSIHGESSYVKI